MHFSTNSPPSPKAASASADARENAVAELVGVVDAADARPPPPADAFSSTGKPISSAAACAALASSMRPVPGTTGTPAASAAAPR